MALVRRIFALRAYRDMKAAIARNEDVGESPMASVWSDVMHVRLDEGDL